MAFIALKRRILFLAVEQGLGVEEEETTRKYEEGNHGKGLGLWVEEEGTKKEER